MKRQIKLKEWGTSSVMSRAPSPAQINASDGSLAPGPFSLRTDPRGYLYSGEPHADPKDGAIVLGDSIVECMFVEEGKRITDAMSRAWGGTVFNGAVSGATSLHLLTSLINKIMSHPPRFVIWMNGILDINCARCPDSFWSNDRYLSPYILPPNVAQPRLRFSGDLDFGVRTSLLATAATACARSEIQMVLATLPCRPPDDFTSGMGQTYTDLAADIEAVNNNTREVARDLDLPLIDLAEDLRSTSGLHYDVYHANQHGAHVIGELLGRELMRLADPQLKTTGNNMTTTPPTEQIAREIYTAYTTAAEGSDGITAPWSILSEEERRQWVAAAEAATRAMSTK